MFLTRSGARIACSNITGYGNGVFIEMVRGGAERGDEIT